MPQELSSFISIQWRRHRDNIEFTVEDDVLDEIEIKKNNKENNLFLINCGTDNIKSIMLYDVM